MKRHHCMVKIYFIYITQFSVVLVGFLKIQPIANCIAFGGQFFQTTGTKPLTVPLFLILNYAIKFLHCCIVVCTHVGVNCHFI